MGHRPVYWLGMFMLLGFGASSCLITISDVEVSCEESCPEAEINVVHAEIDAAGDLDFDANRTERLQAIAKRPHLLPEAQVHLVDVTLARVDFEQNKMRILDALIENPSFSMQAKAQILKKLKHIDFEANRRRLLRRMDEKMGDS